MAPASEMTGVIGAEPVCNQASQWGSVRSAIALGAFFREMGIVMTKIYVGNLPFSADETQVRQLFEQHGTVESVALINDRETGRPRGFGFVEMPRADAQRAIQSLNGKDMGGRPLRVNEAQERQGGGGRGPRGGGGGGGGGRW